ncbi:TolC family outer membrane protein [Methyloligella sp. 2.7D]|uniref:TolC family outer membrane protein n=1 Tax=unclassified Methyloligella TaxID=2625955 RepID=UPI00157C7DFE|nr:TolC family outer membrane protein [Methyloligella sp. GL2]QKP77747.1 TolC family outer membrane protein [Methyloligella sp. GL2]
MLLAFPVSPVSAETLRDALANAYVVNPTLNAQRAALRATDEDVSIAKSGMRPQVFGGAYKSYLNQNSTTGVGVGIGTGTGGVSTLTGDGVTRPYGYSITLSQPLFQGFQNLNAVRNAKSTVQAEREYLRYVEQQVLLQSATAYVDVVQNEAVVRLRENNVKVLAEQLKQTQDRFEVGEVTRTDVAQAEARHADALSELSIAQADLKQSRATYEQLIGHPPSNLIKPPSILHLLPTSLSEAMTLGDGENPQILTSVYQEEASEYYVNQLTGGLLPEVSIEAGYEKDFGLSSSITDQEATTVTGRVTVPLYQGGGVAAQVRQAKEQNHQFKKQVEEARLAVHSDVISSWGVLQSTTAQIRSAESAVRANKIALAGVREEAQVGQRTTLDVLNAQLEYLQSQISLVEALRDRVVAEYSLYSSIGRMDAQTLGLNVPYYDPFEHYDTVKNKWFGLRPPSPPMADE